MTRLDIEQINRMDDLLVKEATEGLDFSERQDLGTLLRSAEPGSADLMQTAAKAQLAFLAGDRAAHAPMPAALRQKLALQARNFKIHQVGQTNVTPIRPVATKASSGFAPYSGWLVAAMLALAFVILRPDAGLPDPVKHRQQLLAAGNPATAWATPEAPEYAAVTGDVVWSDAEQTGYLRLAGMPANNPTESQYQLWIIDPDRDSKPVDGGVFDIPAGSREVLIPIQAKLAVDHPTVFAVTREQPGGVVVSAGPLLVVASTG